MRLVKFIDTLEEDSEEQYGILVYDEDNSCGYGGDFIICLCCLGIIENGDYEIIDDNVVCPVDISTLLKKELEV